MTEENPKYTDEQKVEAILAAVRDKAERDASALLAGLTREEIEQLVSKELL